MNPEYDQKPQIEEPKVKELALLFAEVFGALPWNEVWRCSTCNRFYGSEYQRDNPSPCCTTSLAVAYPEEETKNYIIKELAKPFAQARLFYSETGQLVAFAWGYQIPDTKSLAKIKWPQSTEVQNRVIEEMGKYVDQNFPLYYISEVGVAYPYRGNRIGFTLTQDLVKYSQGLGETAVFRTNWASPMMAIAQRLGMIQIMGPKVEIIKTQIIKTDEIAGFLDTVNPDRVLFIKTS